MATNEEKRQKLRELVGIEVQLTLTKHPDDPLRKTAHVYIHDVGESSVETHHGVRTTHFDLDTITAVNWKQKVLRHVDFDADYPPPSDRDLVLTILGEETNYDKEWCRETTDKILKALGRDD